MPRDTWHLVWGEHSLKISVLKLKLFGIYDVVNIWRKRIGDLINEFVNHKAVYRTAPATRGLLNI